mmetsp:Transcript_11202/g.28786  ORF Transcript_11202/g.28786 Transcript_11202/m.28786 type:complete len:218 (-) Transcript_11202:359-1012(-)
MQQLEDKLRIYVFPGHFGLGVLVDNVPQEELVHDLEVRPRRLQRRLLLLRVEHLVLDARPPGGQCPEQVVRQHEHNVFVDGFAKLPLARVDIVHQLQERLALDLLLPHVLRRVVEVKGEAHQVELLHEKHLPLVRGHLPEPRQRFRVRKVGVRLAQHRQLGLGRRRQRALAVPAHVVRLAGLVPAHPELLLHALQHGGWLPFSPACVRLVQSALCCA